MTRADPRFALLAPLALLFACETQSNQPIAGLQAPSFMTAEWSEWSAPVNLGTVVNSNVADIAPTLSTDGRSLYFTSTRPGGFGSSDLWVSQHACDECPWQAPVNLGSVLNTAGIENRPSLSVDGHVLFFFSDRSGGHGGTDIWMSQRADPKDDFGWGAPVNLGPDVNTADADQAPWYVQNDLYFARGVGTAPLDLYVASVTRDGETGGPAVPIFELNDPAAVDAGPTVRADGREIIFHSTREPLGQFDLYTAARRSNHDLWSAPVKLGALNTAAIEQQPSLSHDGRTLVWSSNRPGSILNPAGLPSFDIYMSTRTPIGN